MNETVSWILCAFTVIGGIAAIGYLFDKWRSERKWSEQEKKVNNDWWESSDLKQLYEKNGCTEFGWSNKDRLSERLSKGKKLVYEVDKKNRIKNLLVNKSGQVLICKK
ncbi:MAG: hypothetical protein PF690_04745 [Deltaproteobacteria bacterium]|jgi:hypothetical protein|nr:hypothetical protein [Deltaproteobacteria bacterium]